MSASCGCPNKSARNHYANPACPLNTTIAALRATGLAWHDVARELGLKNIGPVWPRVAALGLGGKGADVRDDAIDAAIAVGYEPRRIATELGVPVARVHVRASVVVVVAAEEPPPPPDREPLLPGALPVRWGLLTEEQAPKRRSLWCPGYDACLSAAADEGWDGWVCDRCPHHGRTPAPRADGEAIPGGRVPA
jgi:hypothetical protein